MADPVLVVYGDAFQDVAYDFGLFHPLQPIRVRLAMDLAAACGLLQAPGVTVAEPRPATREELAAVHSPAYVEAVQMLGTAGPVHELQDLAAGYGFARSDNPVFHGMDEAASLVVGGTIMAAEAVMSGQALHAFAPAGGLHHAHRARAAGFCIYNDPAAAIAAVRTQYGGRIAYVDVDAHHGDGVQEMFYADSQVLTISLHESGRYLFPGTGFTHELGEGEGRGYSVNLPLEPHTGDQQFLRAVDEVVVPLLRAFKPDLLVTQCGCDSHWLDPLTHLAATTRLWPALAGRFHALAHELCGGRWLATGGGGYDLYSVVPRAWTLLLAGMLEAALPATLPESFLALRHQFSKQPMAEFFLDDPPARDTAAPLHAIDDATDRAIEAVRRAVFPLHGL
jgi:acetoin utilization protein AcuC